MVPSTPAMGDVLVPMVIDRLGSSTVMPGSGTGSARSASVSPMVMSAMPEMAMISPAPASVASTRSRLSVTYSSVILAVAVVPSVRHQATL